VERKAKGRTGWPSEVWSAEINKNNCKLNTNSPTSISSSSSSLASLHNGTANNHNHNNHINNANSIKQAKVFNGMYGGRGDDIVHANGETSMSHKAFLTLNSAYSFSNGIGLGGGGGGGGVSLMAQIKNNYFATLNDNT
jgi:hypothetical protein